MPNIREEILQNFCTAEEVVIPQFISALNADYDAVKVESLARDLFSFIKSYPQSWREKITQSLIKMYPIYSPNGQSLIAIIEGLQRIPDKATQDALIEENLLGKEWSPKHRFQSGMASFVAILLDFARHIKEQHGRSNFRSFLSNAGRAVTRYGFKKVTSMMAGQFIAANTIDEIMQKIAKIGRGGNLSHYAHSSHLNDFYFSYDILGEAAITPECAQRALDQYRQAIIKLGSLGGDDIYERSGLSIKLSALHPTYNALHKKFVMVELVPALAELFLLAKEHNVMLTIDAEESDKLDLSLDVLQEVLTTNKDLSGFAGIGFVVQAYQKSAPFVIDFISDLARKTGCKIAVRLVKGAYWDGEIKRAQVAGQADYPVYTQKAKTDVSYIYCAKKLLESTDAIYSQFGTHNIHTICAVFHLAEKLNKGRECFEFQLLLGMGETIYRPLIKSGKIKNRCRIYSPVGDFSTLLPYLVRRIMENGSNASFLHKLFDGNSAVESIQDPLKVALGDCVQNILKPKDIFIDRANSNGLGALAGLAKIHDHLSNVYDALEKSKSINIYSPINKKDRIGSVELCDKDDLHKLLKNAKDFMPKWQSTAVEDRAKILEKAGDIIESRYPEILAILVREAGKHCQNGMGEVREAVDFLRYYALHAESICKVAQPLGLVLCISPWNFPFAIFLGQVSAALVAGNVVIAKPAELAPISAKIACEILYEAGLPTEALQLACGNGVDVGEVLVKSKYIAGVMFTGSTKVAKIIQQTLAGRSENAPIPLIAETGGQNAMIVDSSALLESMVLDVIESAFASAGQRCSAIRLLCLQEEIADKAMELLKSAAMLIKVGSTAEIGIDVGPVISDQAKRNIINHVEKMRAAGYNITQTPKPESLPDGHFVMPTIVEIPSIGVLKEEIFGPVVHVVRYKVANLPQLVEEVNATGYGLTFSVHSRIKSRIKMVLEGINAGNLYVNRNSVGAVVGVQPFGGTGLSGTGPKAGGPVYLARMLACYKDLDLSKSLISNYVDDVTELEKIIANPLKFSNIDRAKMLLSVQTLNGPVGELNQYLWRARGVALCFANESRAILIQLIYTLFTGNKFAIVRSEHLNETIVQSYGNIIRFIEEDLTKKQEISDDLALRILHLWNGHYNPSSSEKYNFGLYEYNYKDGNLIQPDLLMIKDNIAILWLLWKNSASVLWQSDAALDYNGVDVILMAKNYLMAKKIIAEVALKSNKIINIYQPNEDGRYPLALLFKEVTISNNTASIAGVMELAK